MKLRRTLLGLVAATSFALAADPALMSLLMRDPKLVAGIDVERAKNTPLGQKLLADVHGTDNNFQQFLSDTGFDPRRDIREVLIASTGTQDPNSGLILVKGIFNPTKIAAFAQSQGVTATSYKGVDLWRAPVSKVGTGAMAFLDGTIAILGPEENVKAAIDRRQAGNGGLNSTLAAKVASWSTINDAWVVSNVGIAGFGPFPNQGKSVQGFSVDSVRAASAGVRFGKVVEVTAEATMNTAQDASAMADGIRFVAGFVKTNGDMHGGKAPEQIVNMLETLQVSNFGTALKVNFAVPQADLEALMNMGHAKTAQAERKAGPNAVK